MPTAPPLIAATSTLAMVRTAIARGIPVDDLLAAARLTHATLEDPDARIPAPTVLALWSALRERAGDPALQLAAPTTLPFGAYRVIDYLVAASATVGAGVLGFVRFFGLIADAITLTVEQDGDEHRLRLATAAGGAVPPVYVDYVFAALVSRIRMRVRTALAVQRVELQQPEPADATPWRAVYRAPVVFGAPADLLCFSADEWRAPTDSHDAALACVLEEHARLLAARVPAPPSDIRSVVRKTIADAPADITTAADVARALHMSVRTLQRKLDESGTTFRELADEVRSRLATGYLADPRVSVAEVAFLLGFSDQSSFNRAFRRWTGQTPGRWRLGHR